MSEHVLLILLSSQLLSETVASVSAVRTIQECLGIVRGDVC